MSARTTSLKHFTRVAASPLAAGIGTVLAATLVLTTILLTSAERQWMIFLSGVLVSGVIAFFTHPKSRWVIVRRQEEAPRAVEAPAAAPAPQPGRTEKVADHQVERSAARARIGFDLVDAAMPAMLAYLDAGRVLRYHNRAYRQWVGLPEHAIDGRSLQEILGRRAYEDVLPKLDEAFAGREVRYESVRSVRGGESLRLLTQYIPHFVADGKVAGTFEIVTEITPPQEMVSADDFLREEAAHVAARVAAALERDEFCLYSQAIVPLVPSHTTGAFCEVLVRLRDEEENHMPAGSFIAIAEEHGLVPQIDRWVVRKMVDLAAEAPDARPALFMLNVAAPTIAEGGFAEYVRGQIERGLGNTSIGFEFPEGDVAGNPQAYREFTNGLAGTGCRFAVSGFGQIPGALELAGNLGVHFLKIDGDLVLNLIKKGGNLAQVKAINAAAHAAGMQTVAECVENELTRAALRRIETDFAQGFGVSTPRPIQLTNS